MEEFEEKDVEGLVSRFKNMLNSGNNSYFEDEEMELIIDNFMQNLDFSYATKAIDYAISLFPSDSFFRILRVKKLILELQLDQAKDELNTIESMFPPSADFYVEKVMLSRMTGTDEHAMELLQKAYALDPEDPEVHFMLAYEYLKQSDVDNGIKHAIAAMEQDEMFDENLFTFSYLFDESKQFEAAVKFFSALADRFPLNKGTWFGLGLAYSWVEQQDKAIDAYQFALTIDDKISTAYFNIANSYFDSGKIELALENYKKAYELDDNDVSAINGIADCYGLLENYSEALYYYQQALLISPNYINSILGVIAILKDTGKDDEAKEFVNKSFQSNPQSFELLFTVLDYYEPDERLATVISLFDSTLKLVNNKADFFVFFTMFCIDNYRLDVGIEILKTHIDDEDIASTAPYLMAAFLYVKGDIASANNYLSNALLIDYDGYERFLSINPVLETLSDVQHLIQMYKPY